MDSNSNQKSKKWLIIWKKFWIVIFEKIQFLKIWENSNPKYLKKIVIRKSEKYSNRKKFESKNLNYYLANEEWKSEFLPIYSVNYNYVCFLKSVYYALSVGFGLLLTCSTQVCSIFL